MGDFMTETFSIQNAINLAKWASRHYDRQYVVVDITNNQSSKYLVCPRQNAPLRGRRVSYTGYGSKDFRQE